MHLTRCITLWIALLVVSGSASTAEIKFQHLSVDQGLSRSWVKCIFQDSRGFLWFGTSDGLNRYDGYDFSVYKYDAADPHSINSNNINTIYEDSHNRLWVGTQEGLCRYDRELDNFLVPDIFNIYVSCILELSSDKLLVGTTNGLFLVNPETFATEIIYPVLYVYDMLLDFKGDLWVATINGLQQIDTSDFAITTYRKTSEKKTSISDNNLRCLYEQSPGKIWIGTTNRGIIMMEYKPGGITQPVFHNYSPHPEAGRGISTGAILDIQADANGNLWIGVENGGLNIIPAESLQRDNIKFEKYEHIPTDGSSLSSNSVHCIFRDRQQTMWVGTYSGGLNYFNELRYKFRHYKHIPQNPNSLKDNSVNVIYPEEDKVWIGTEGGLSVMNRNTGTFRHYVHDPADPSSLGSNAVWSIARDLDGNLWVGTWAGGLNLMDEEKGTFRHYYHDPEDPHTIGSNSVYAIIPDTNEVLWLATMGGGLNRFDLKTGEFERYMADYTRESWISNDWLFSVTPCHPDEIWISTTDAVDIFNIRTGSFMSFIHNPAEPSSISYNGAVVIYQDSKANIWVGTNAGLDLFNRTDSSFVHYTVEDGLPNNTIKSICEDEKGNLWLATNNGISKFIDGISIPVSPVFKNYDVSDGLQGNEFNDRSCAASADGTMFFGGTNGLNIFHPDSLIYNTFKPEIRFTDLYIFNQKVDITDPDSPVDKHIDEHPEIKLPYRYSVFSITYAALDYIAPDKNQYAFMMEGFEEQWNFVGTQRMATYTNLNPGNYIFRVRASNSDGEWNDEGIELQITLLPPWWATLLAKIIYALLAVAALLIARSIFINSYKLKQQLKLEQIEKQKSEELNRMKLQFFTNISHELRTPLTLISGPLDRVRRRMEKSTEMDIISRNVARLRKLVDQILDFRSVENEVLELKTSLCDINTLVKNVILYFHDLAEQKNINLRYRAGYRNLTVHVDQDKVEKIITNLLINAIKYTPEGGDVHVDLERGSVHENMIRISIADSGRGISPENLDHIFDRFYTSGKNGKSEGGTGIGLHLTKRLVELHGGRIDVQSELDNGTVFTVHLPWQGEHSGPEIEEINFSSPFPDLVSEDPPFDAGNYSDEGKRLVIVIDDNIDMCKFLEGMLRSRYAVITETDPVKGLELVNRELPELVISDVMMPGLDGFELCRRLKSNISTSHIPLILLTAKAGTEDQLTGLETGADDYISKPFAEEVVLARVKNLIRQREKIRKHFSMGEDPSLMRKGVNSLDREFMEKVHALIRKHYIKPDFGVKTIIDEMNMSRSVFYSKFKALSDISINELIRHYRLKQAKRLLLENRYTINEVALRTGFSDASYFGKVFKEEFGQTPGDFLSSELTGLNHPI